MNSLRELHVQHNKLSSLPDETQLLEYLETLNLSNNKFSQLPSFLAEMSHLQNFFAAGNPVKGIPRDIVEAGSKSLLDALKGSSANPLMNDYNLFIYMSGPEAKERAATARG
tara:strand:+ start:146 stop:481 length:336 start_codon:yes stop_codon:yes gene_type:complete